MTPSDPPSAQVTFTRHRGRPVTALTVDVSNVGMHVTTDRPLSVDERLCFDVDLGRAHLDGHARVVCQQGINSYSLRFEDVDATAAERLAGVLRGAA